MIFLTYLCVCFINCPLNRPPLPLLSAGLLIWNYYVTMPMPASTFTLAVGYWHQVTADIPSALEDGARGTKDCCETAKPGCAPGPGTEPEVLSGLGSSTSDVIKDSSLQNCRYFFPVFFFLSFLLTRVVPSNIPLQNFPLAIPSIRLMKLG